MTPINGRPILEYQVQWMRTQGVTDIVFLTGYLSETVRSHFGDGSAFGIKAHYSNEDEPLGRGGAVRRGMGLVPDDEDTVLVTNGDTITNLNLSLLLEIHRKRNVLATVMLTRHPSQFGLVHVGEDDMVEEFVEKGLLPLWVNAGVYLFDTSIKTHLPEKGDHEVSTFPSLAIKKRLAALRSDAMWLAVDNAKDVSEASKLLADWEP